jgi:dipeptidyl-peptidase-4
VASTPGAPVLDPQLSPDGTMLAYVRGDELHVTPSTSGEAKQLTFGAGGQGKVSAAGSVLSVQTLQEGSCWEQLMWCGEQRV